MHADSTELALEWLCPHGRGGNLIAATKPEDAFNLLTGPQDSWGRSRRWWIASINQPIGHLPIATPVAWPIFSLLPVDTPKDRHLPTI